MFTGTASMDIPTWSQVTSKSTEMVGGGWERTERDQNEKDLEVEFASNHGRDLEDRTR